MAVEGGINMTDNPSKFFSSKFGIQYSDASILNTLDVHLPADPPKDSSTLWIVFIHGGGWRDPTQTSRDLKPALDYLDPSKHKIAGIASINYRLSPHANIPAEPGSPDEQARSARHPTHIEDVLTAIVWLQKEYRFSNNYVLSGHSAGATLSFQTVMGQWSVSDSKASSGNPSPPLGIVGLCGIYDIGRLVDTHSDQPIYKQMISGAFGDDPSQWQAASPVAGKYHHTWPDGKAAVIAPSADDELVDAVQEHVMSSQLGIEARDGRSDVVMILHGKHDQVVSEGKEVARAIIKCLEMVSV